MKTISLLTFVACVAASALMSSCSNEENAATNEENAATNGQLTAFTGGIVTEAPMTRVQLGASKSSTVAPGFLTRTSMDRLEVGDKGSFFWEAGDVIYVQDDEKKLRKSQSNITAKAASHTFLVDGAYGANGANASYDVYYSGTNSGTDPKKVEVVIPARQTQTAFNDTKHFGASGDCGVAKATKNTEAGKSGYTFDLEHKAAYLCFIPYFSQYLPDEPKIKSIQVTSDTNIAGTYDLSSTGLSGEGSSKTITLRAGEDGLVLADKTVDTKNITNSLYMVVAPAPGKHTIKVKYTLFDTMINKSFAVIKSYSRRTLAANTIYDIPVNLDMAIPSYGGHNYYMWDAKENYWSGHEWDSTDPWQPATNDAENEKYPESKEADGPRWYNEGGGAFEASVNPLFSQLPNANEMAWYVMKGDPHWDNTTQWEAFGEKHTGGIWLKKLSVIADENHTTRSDLKNKAPEDNENAESYYSFPASVKLNENEFSKYFFLPALGFYTNGQFNGLGSYGYYWSSSANPSNSDEAYILYFCNAGVYVDVYPRTDGYVAQPFE